MKHQLHFLMLGEVVFQRHCHGLRLVGDGQVLAAGRALAVQSQVLMQRLQTLALHLGSGRRVVCSMAQSRTRQRRACQRAEASTP